MNGIPSLNCSVCSDAWIDRRESQGFRFIDCCITTKAAPEECVVSVVIGDVGSGKFGRSLIGVETGPGSNGVVLSRLLKGRVID